ncbi:MAG: deoxyribose-phosphate aldolase [Deltaproteobacteria bacterium]|nr:deoxyribose-phosphate aldolase [Deltaproteobacteria bacterium]
MAHIVEDLLPGVEEVIADAARVHEEALEHVCRFCCKHDVKGAPETARKPDGPNDVAAYIDHTILKAEATPEAVKKVCAEAREHRFATVCVNSCHIALAASELAGSGVLPISVVGFPFGAASPRAKASEAMAAIDDGAREIDTVVNIGWLKAGLYREVLADIIAVVEASRPYPVKVIIETCLLSDGEKAAACALAKAAGAAFVKTSTGFSSSGATEADVRLMRRVVGDGLGVKASGGVRTFKDLRAMLAAGASRIGSSNSVAIVQEAGKA